MTADDRADQVVAFIDEMIRKSTFDAAAVAERVAATIRDALRGERELCIGAAMAAAPNWHNNRCGCGECTGVAGAVEKIRELP